MKKILMLTISLFFLIGLSVNVAANPYEKDVGVTKVEKKINFEKTVAITVQEKQVLLNSSQPPGYFSSVYLFEHKTPVSLGQVKVNRSEKLYLLNCSIRQCWRYVKNISA